MRLLRGGAPSFLVNSGNEGQIVANGFLEICIGVPLDGADRDPVGEPDHFDDPHIQC